MKGLSIRRKKLPKWKIWSGLIDKAKNGAIEIEKRNIEEMQCEIFSTNWHIAFLEATGTARSGLWATKEH